MRRLYVGTTVAVLALVLWWLCSPPVRETLLDGTVTEGPAPSLPVHPVPRPSDPGVPALDAAQPAKSVQPPDDTTSRDTPADSGREVVVLGPGDRPVSGVRVYRDETNGPFVETGNNGKAALPWEFPEGTPRVHLTGAAPDMNIALPERSTVVRLPRLLPLEVAVVDGLTNLPVPGGSVSLRRSHGEPVPLRALGSRFLLDPPLLRAGETERMEFLVALPAGYASAVPGDWTASGAISRYADRARVEFTAWPKADIRVRVRETDGTPVAGARVLQAHCGTWRMTEVGAATTDSAGVVRIEGVPFIRGERLSLAAGFAGRFAGPENPSVLDDPGAAIVAEIVLPKDGVENASWLAGEAGGMFGGRRGGKRNLHLEGGACGGEPAKTAVVVEVRRRDGTPAADALVVVTMDGGSPREERTGPDGIVKFSPVPSGEVTASLKEPGLLAAPVKGAVAWDQTVLLVLAEDGGTSSKILVKDAEGRPAAGAAISVSLGSSLPWVFMEGEVQVFGVRTGPDGTCNLTGLPAGPFAVTAVLGSRAAKVSAEAGQSIEVVLPEVP